MRLCVLPAVLLVASCAAEPSSKPWLSVPPSVAVLSALSLPRPGLRLPEIAEPLRYAVSLTLRPSATTFDGEATIDLQFIKPTRMLWLHGGTLSIAAAHLEMTGSLSPAQVVPGDEDTVGFAFAEERLPGPARLHVSYRGTISDRDDRGIFLEEEEGHRYLFSQFESTEARRAFPCFDEPSYKVPWQLTLRVPEGDVALSNTKVISETREADGMKSVRFAETPPLPSYLVAFAVGPFELVDAGKAGQNGTPLRVATPRGQAAQAASVAPLMGELLTHVEHILGSAYPYEKLDVVAVPRLASFGAMENPGLITASKPKILAKPDENTVLFERGLAAILTHEMAHQWFGDWVSPMWWNDLWLNEAFATWMEDKVLQAARPAWHGELSRARSTAWAMRVDGLLNTRTICQPIGTKDDIINAFDDITYSKGAAVIEMIESFSGPERFLRGVRSYLNVNQHGKVTTHSLLSALRNETLHDESWSLTTFLEQPGVPLVRGELVCNKGYPQDATSSARLMLHQSRYLPRGSKAIHDPIWRIPVCVRWGAGKEQGRACTWLTSRDGTLELTGALRCPDWILLNADAVGYYRSGFTDASLSSLLRGGGKQLSLTERLAVARDMEALVASGDLSLVAALSRIPELMNDPAPSMVQAALNLATSIRDAFVPAPLRPNYARFLQEHFGARARAIGWLPRPGEDPEITLLRTHLVPVLADRGEDPELLAEARRLTEAWLDHPASVPSVAVEMVTRTAASRGDQALFDRMRAELSKATDDGRQRRLVRALAGFRTPALVQASLELFLSPVLDPRVGVELFFSQDERMGDVVLDLLKRRFDDVLARIPGDLRGDLPSVGESFCDEAHRAALEALFKNRIGELVGGPRTLAKTLEQIARCSAEVEAQAEPIAAFLKATRRR